MKTRIAVLEVVVADDPFTPTELSGDGQFFRLTLNSKNAELGGLYGDLAKTPEFAKTSIAHELGHFLNFLTGEPNHVKVMQAGPFAKRTVPGSIYPSETKAWESAAQIFPNLDQRVKKLALQSYEDHGFKEVGQ